MSTESRRARESELKACPFCGGEVKLYREPYCGGQQAGINPIGLLCSGCKTTHLFDAHESQVMLKKHWNTRPIEDDLRAEVERLRREQAEFTGAVLCALGVNRDESVAPGNQVLAEVERLRGELAEAEEAIREAPIETDGSGCYKGRASDWFDLPAVRRATEWK